MARLTCECGGEIPRPVPGRCPHCGKRIARVRRGVDWLSPLIIALLFLAVLAALYWLTSTMR